MCCMVWVIVWYGHGLTDSVSASVIERRVWTCGWICGVLFHHCAGHQRGLQQRWEQDRIGQLGQDANRVVRRELCGVRGEGVGCPVQLMHRVLLHRGGGSLCSLFRHRRGRCELGCCCLCCSRKGRGARVVVVFARHQPVVPQGRRYGEAGADAGGAYKTGTMSLLRVWCCPCSAFAPCCMGVSAVPWHTAWSMVSGMWVYG